MQTLAPVAERSVQSPLRHSLTPLATQSAPIASSPATSPPSSISGGVHTGVGEPNAFSHVYGGSPGKRRAGQSAALRHVAVHPTPGTHRLVPHSVPPAVHGFSMSTQTRNAAPATFVHA